MEGLKVVVSFGLKVGRIGSKPGTFLKSSFLFISVRTAELEKKGYYKVPDLSHQLPIRRTLMPSLTSLFESNKSEFENNQ